VLILHLDLVRVLFNYQSTSMNLKAYVFVFLLVTLFGTVSRATSRFAVTPSTPSSEGFLFEPGVAYSSGVLTQSGTNAILTKVFSAEARLGYKIWEMTFGLSYRAGFGTGEQATGKGDFKPTDIGVYLEYELPWSFRLFGSYLVDARSKIQSSDNPGDFSGTGTRLGIAYADFFFGTTLMIESVSRTYSKYESSDLSRTIQDSNMGASLSYQF
jgi:hypothetical protein